MKKYCWTKNGYTIRLAQTTDAENYYLQNYNPLDKETARLTGCKENFSKDEVISFFLKSIQDTARYYFLITSPDNRIIGETVINEIDNQTKSANLRIGIFQSSMSILENEWLELKAFYCICSEVAAEETYLLFIYLYDILFIS